MLQIPGPPALSTFRLAKLLERLQALEPTVLAVDARFMHFVDLAQSLSTAQHAVLQKLLALFQADLPGPAARERAMAVVALCIGGLAAARGVTDPGLAQELRQAAYRQAQIMLKARPC